MNRVLVVRPDGTAVVLDSTDPCEAVAEVCGGGFAERLPEAFHGLDHFEVWHADDFTGLEVNLPASRLAGMDLTACAPLCGPVVLWRLPEGEDLAAERVHQRQFFGLDAGAVRTTDRESVVEMLLRVESAA